MGTIADKLRGAYASRQAVKTAIEEKNVPITDSTKFSEYAELINTYLVYPQQTTTIVNTNQYDVTNSHYAQVNEPNLIANNIRSTVSVLGVRGGLVVNTCYRSIGEPDDSLGIDGDIYLQIFE